MVDAKLVHKPPFTAYWLPGGDIFIRRESTILRIQSANRSCELIEYSAAWEHKLESFNTSKKEIYGIFGQKKLVDNNYLILIEEATMLGQLFTACSEIYRVEKLMFVNLRNTKNPFEIAQSDQVYVEMMLNL